MTGNMKILYMGKNRQQLALTDLVVLNEFYINQYKEISVPQAFADFENDYRLDYLCGKIEGLMPQIILIDLNWFSENDYLGARFANHIRLNKWKNVSFKEIPIVLLRSEPIDITKSDSVKDDLMIFAGKGAYFSTFDDLSFTEYDTFSGEDWSSNIFAIYRRHREDFDFTRYLKTLKFSEQHEDSHSVANQWGALRLAHNIGYTSDDIEYNWPPKLYFKYLQANYDFKPITSPIQITAKVLLIDDNADKGWEKVLKKLFKFDDNNPTLDEKGRPKFVTVNEKVKDYDSLSEKSRIIIEEQDFDLYLVDLRLNGADEDITTETRNFSGATVLQKIKSLNAGNQVIMFTASNKAWNMRALLSGENAADGYYIKESPLNASDKSFGESNTKSFLQQIDLALESKFLKDIVLFENSCIEFVDTDLFSRESHYQDYYFRAISSFKVGFELCKKSILDAKYRNLAYLAYYQILEDYAGQEANFKYITDSECYVKNGSVRIIDDSTGDIVWQLRHVKDSRHGDYFKKVPTIADRRRPQSLASISFILCFKFNVPDVSNNIGHITLKKWGKITNIRNKKAGHGGDSGLVTEDELFDLLKIVKLFLTNP